MSTKPSSRKPTFAANLILLFFLLLVLGAFAGGGWWAFNKFVRKKSSKPVAVVVTPVKKPTTTTTTTTPPAVQPSTTTTTTTTKPPGVIEQPSIASTTTPPATTTPPVTTVPDNPPTISPGTTPPTGPTIASTTQPPATPPGTTDVLPPVTIAQTTPPVTPPTDTEDPIVALPPEEITEVPPQPDQPIAVFQDDSPEVKALKEDADRRIDEAPPDLYPDREKSRVRMALRNSRKLARVATLHFASGSTKLGTGEQTRLRKALVSPEASDLMADPDVAVVCIGFADQTGDPQRNKEISTQRAMNVIDVLKKNGVKSTTYPVAIGGTKVISEGNKGKNRAVEVWLVLQ